MHKLNQQLLFKLTALLLVVVMLTPVVIRYADVFVKHEHVLCEYSPKAHVHTLDAVCDFYNNIKFNYKFIIPSFTFQLFPVEDNHKIIRSQYVLLSSYQQLHFSLRGPPQINLI